jgi:hypothetical protein
MTPETLDSRQPRCFTCAHYVDQKCIKHKAVVRGFGDQRSWLHWPIQYSPYAIKCEKGYEVRK